MQRTVGSCLQLPQPLCPCPSALLWEARSPVLAHGPEFTGGSHSVRPSVPFQPFPLSCKWSLAEIYFKMNLLVKSRQYATALSWPSENHFSWNKFTMEQRFENPTFLWRQFSNRPISPYTYLHLVNKKQYLEVIKTFGASMWFLH